MGKKKFIDKKRSTTYYLSSGPQVDPEPDGEGGPVPPSFDEFDDPELAALLGMDGLYGDSDYQLTEDRRREIIELGFPDDGYDYLRHLRDPMPTAPPKAPVSQPVEVLDLPEAEPARAGPSNAVLSSEVPAAPIGGPYVFIPAAKFKAPLDDAQLVDARQLRVAGTVDAEADADAAANTVSAFTRSAAPSQAAVKAGAVDVTSVAVSVGLRGRLVKELAELEESMTRLEADAGPDDDEQGSQQPETTTRAVEGVQGNGEQQGEEEAGPSAAHQVAIQGDEEWADWLDEFVVMASADAPSTTTSSAAQHTAHTARPTDTLPSTDAAHEASYSDEDDSSGSWVGDDEGDSHDGAAGPHTGAAGEGSGKGRSKPAGSIASTYWRPERHDRGTVLENIDEHFENLALQYNDDELGELEDDEVADKARGTADISMFESVLDDFLTEEKAKRANASQQQGNGVNASGNDSADSEGGEGDDSDVCSGDEDRGTGQYEAMRAKAAMHTGKANKVECLDQRDLEALAATRARLAAVSAETGGDGTCASSGDVLPDRLETVVIDRGERWDCESVLSLRSNLDNHPGRIVEPQMRTGARGGAKIALSHKTGMPVLDRGTVKGGMGVSETIQEEDSVSADDSGSDVSESDTLQGAGLVLERRKGETAEEKRARKAAVKDAKRANRAAKKELKTMFRSEAVKQKKSAAGRAGVGGGGALSSTYTLS